MPKNDQQEAYEKALSANLSRVNDWVKFAEAKNAALLAFASAWAVAIGNALAKEEGPSEQFANFLPVAGSLFLVAAVIAVLSFIPATNLSKFFKGHAAISRPLNLLFFGDLATLPISEASARLRDRYMPGSGQTATDDYLGDLANQIHVNSVIADRKFKQFKAAAWVVVLALGTLAIPAIKFVSLTALRLAIEVAQ